MNIHIKINRMNTRNKSIRFNKLKASVTVLATAIVLSACEGTSVSVTPTASVSVTPTASVSVTPTASVSVTPTASVSVTPTASVSVTPTASVSVTPTASVSVTPTASVSMTPTASVSMTPTASVSVTPTASVSVTPTINTALIPTLIPLCDGVSYWDMSEHWTLLSLGEQRQHNLFLYEVVNLGQVHIEPGTANSGWRLVGACETSTVTPSATPTFVPTISMTITPSVELTATPSVTVLPTPTHVMPVKRFYGNTLSKGNAAALADIKLIYSAYIDKYLYARTDVSEDQKFIWYAIDERFETWVSDKKAITTSESHGYGMLALVLMDIAAPGYDVDAQQDFDAMLRYFLAFPSELGADLMAWQQWTDGINNTTGAGSITNIYNTPNGADSAIDGDMDIAYALLLAHKQWGSAGTYDYKAHALKVIQAIKNRVVHPNEYVLLLGDWVNIYDAKYGKSTRASDFMIQHLIEFAKADVSNSVFWNQVIVKTTAIYEENVSLWSANTGLVADFLVLNANGNYEPSAPNFLEGANDGDYYYNSARVPWRLSTDYLYNGEEQLKDEMLMLDTWIQQSSHGSVNQIYPGYRIGSGFANNTVGQAFQTSYTDLTFTAPFVVSAAINPNSQTWFDTLWARLAINDVDSQGYFGNSIRLLSMFAASGYWAEPSED